PRPQVAQYAWLPPTDAGATPRLVLLADGQVEQVTLAADGGGAERLDPLGRLAGAAPNDLAVAPNGQVAVLVGGAGAAVFLNQARDGDTHMKAEPAGRVAGGAPVPGSLVCSASGRYVVYRQAAAAGAERLMLMDTANGKT